MFANEAFQSGNFTRIAAAEIDNVELHNPNVAADKQSLLEVLAQSTEITTCLPSVDFYDSDDANNAASLIADGLKNSTAKTTIIYTAENNNHAAEILGKAVNPVIEVKS